MNSELLDVIKIANREFQEFIDQVSQVGSKVVESRGAMRRLEKVDIRLRQVTEYLAAISGHAEATPEEAYEFLRYRENLKALRNALETLQFSLMSERARLENVRANMQAACAWAASVRDIS
jgi:CHAD domain-containing protein